VRKCRRRLGSDPDGIGQPYPEKPAGMLPSRYAWLLDRLDAAEDDLGLPLTLGVEAKLGFPARPHMLRHACGFAKIRSSGVHLSQLRGC